MKIENKSKKGLHQQTKTEEEAETYPQLIQDLYDLLSASRQLLSKRTMNYPASQTLAENIAEARSLLSELGGLTGRGVPDRETAHQFSLLKEKFFELEGVVKEYRNGLAESRDQQ